MHQCHRALSVLLRVSHPSQVVLPFPRWEPKEKPVKEDDVGPQVTHIYEVIGALPLCIMPFMMCVKMCA